MQRDGRWYVDLSSNDYLALSQHPRLVAAAESALRQYGTGSGASRLMSGDLRLHHELEAGTASFKRKEAALVFNSGYQANVGLIPALVGRHDAVFADRLGHASLLDGVRASGAELFRFRHNDPEHLEGLLGKHRGAFGRALLVTESVFSMDGDVAPLADLVELKNRFHCALLVDEAHATGVFGPQGRGKVEQEGLTPEVEVLMGTFSKALGGFGAYVAASRTVIGYLVNVARSFIYSTALPLPVIAADLAAVELLEDGLDRGAELIRKALRFRRALRSRGWPVLGSSQIVPVVVGQNSKALKLSRRLDDAGFYAVPVRPPTVPEGTARLRFSLCHAHAEEQLDRLVEVLGANG